MTAAGPGARAEEWFSGHPDALAIFSRVRSIIEGLGPCEVHFSKSQVAFRRTRGFAYVWLPGQYLTNPGAEVVLSIALGRPDESPRFKEVAHPAPAHWMHHIEVRDVAEPDAQVLAWLREATDRA